MTKACEHDFVYEGVRFKIGDRLPSSDARAIEYFDSYACRRCLVVKLKSLGVSGNTFGPIRHNARPLRKDP